MADILEGCVEINVEWHLFWIEKIAIILWSIFSVDIARPAHKCHRLATVTTFTCQLVKCTSWHKCKTQSICQLKNTAYWIFLSRWAPVTCYVTLNHKIKLFIIKKTSLTPVNQTSLSRRIGEWAIIMKWLATAAIPATP